MLENCKIVLNGVHDNKQLFRKELIKSMAWLNSQEQNLLKHWVKERFYNQHADVINEILNTRYDFAS